jgi:hypothetical protein
MRAGRRVGALVLSLAIIPIATSFAWADNENRSATPARDGEGSVLESAPSQQVSNVNGDQYLYREVRTSDPGNEELIEMGIYTGEGRLLAAPVVRVACEGFASIGSARRQDDGTWQLVVLLDKSGTGVRLASRTGGDSTELPAVGVGVLEHPFVITKIADPSAIHPEPIGTDGVVSTQCPPPRGGK